MFAPPIPGGDGPVAVVVSDDGAVGIQPPAAERRRKLGAIRQRMPAFVGIRSARKIVVEVRVARARYVAAQVRGSTGRRVRQCETAVDGDPIGAAELARQSRNVDERQDVADVQLEDRLDPRARQTRSGAEALNAAPPLLEARARRERRPELQGEPPRAPVLLDLVGVRTVVGVGKSRRVVLGSRKAGEAVVEHQRGDPLGVRGRSHDRHLRRLALREEHRTTGPGGSHDRE